MKPTCQAVAPEIATEGAYCVCCGRPARVPDADWLHLGGTNCYKGFVRNERFGPNDMVIPGTNRAKSRAMRRANS